MIFQIIQKKGLKMLQTMKHILTHTDETLLAKKFGYNNVEKFIKTKTFF